MIIIRFSDTLIGNMLIDCEIVKQNINHGVDETFMICFGLPYMRRSIGIDMIYIKRIRVSTLSLRDHSSVNSFWSIFPSIFLFTV